MDLVQAQKELDELRKEYRVLGDEIYYRCNAISKFIYERDANKQYSFEEALEVYDSTGGENTARYEAFQNLLKTYNKQWDGCELYPNGYHPKTNQRSLSLIIRKTCSNDTLLKYSNFISNNILPYYKYQNVKIADQQYKCKLLYIFEHTLSEYGVYRLVCGENKFDINMIRYGRGSTEISFDDLYNALVYIRENHWYGDEE